MELGEGMKKSFEDVSQVVKKLKVEIPRQVVEKKMDESFLNLQKKAKVKGFRPGKAPLSIIKTRFADSVIEQLEEDLVKEGYFEAVKGSDIKAVAITEIKDGKYVEGENFHFTALIEVLPDFEPANYRGIEISKINQEVADEEINSEIETMREAQVVYKPVERKSVENDLLEISFKAFDGDEVIQEIDDSTYIISPTPALGEEFDKNILGKRAGDDLDFEVSYPDDFHIDQVKGKKIRYDIRIKSVKEKVLPEVNDDFAKSIPEVESLDDLKNKIRDHLRSRKEEEEVKTREGEIIDALVEKNPIDVPETLVDEEIMRMIRETESRLRSQGIQFDPSQIDLRQLREKYREGAVKSVKSSLILGEIGKKEKFEVTDEDVESDLKGISEKYNISFEKVASYYEDEKSKKSLKNMILEKKVMEFLLKDGVEVAEKGKRDAESEKGKTDKKGK